MEKQTKEPTTASQLRARIRALNKLGVKNSQLREVLELSYTGMHKLAEGTIQPAASRLSDYHRKLSAWCQRISKC